MASVYHPIQDAYTPRMSTLPGRGLVSYGPDGSQTYLPLISLSARVSIVDVSARVVLTQLYVSDDNHRSSKAQYIFPVPANGAVCAFQMRASDGQVVTGVVMERSKAKREYDIAVSNDKWAGLLYESTPDVFVISIGAIPRGQDIQVTITYVVELSDGDLHDRVEFSLPTYIAERYGTAPPVLMAPSSLSESAIFEVTAHIHMASEIVSVTSPSHLITVATKNGRNRNTSRYTSTVRLAPEARDAGLNRDFVLAIHALNLEKIRCVAEKTASETVAMMLTLVPRFRLDHIPTQEYIFLIDRSGSMTGSKIEQAKQALILFLQSLPKDGTFFNIFSFGSRFSSLWSASERYTDSARAIALRHVDAMSADMGGTEIKSGLQAALDSQMCSNPTSLFLLTDGEVWDCDTIYSLVDREVLKAGTVASGTYLRIFTLGIGDAASTALCHGVARRGNGLCLMTLDSAEISEKVSKLFLASRVSPLGNMGNIEIDWGYASTCSDSARMAAHDKGTIPHRVADRSNPLGSTNTHFHITLPDPPKIQQAPTKVPNLYPANRFTVFVILSDTTEVPKAVTLRGTLPDGSQLTIPPIPVHETASNDLPPLIHTLAANRLILELEDGDPASQGSFDTTDRKLKDEVIEAAVVRFSETYQLASRYASFIAVYEAQDGHLSSDTDSDSFQDGRQDTSEDESESDRISEDDIEGDQRPPSNHGSVADPHTPDDDLDQQDADSDNNSWHARLGDGADPRADSPDSFSSVSSMSSHSLSVGFMTKLWNKLFKSRKTRLPLRREVDMPGAWLEAEPKIIVTQAGFKPRKKATATASSTARTPIFTAARLQQFDGSFNLDQQLSAFIGNKLSTDEVKAAMPSRIQGTPDAEKVWATVLAAAYMKVHLGDDKDMWFGLWKKAEDYIKSVLGNRVSFASLVDEASKLLSS